MYGHVPPIHDHQRSDGYANGASDRYTPRSDFDVLRRTIHLEPPHPAEEHHPSRKRSLDRYSRRSSRRSVEPYDSRERSVSKHRPSSRYSRDLRQLTPPGIRSPHRPHEHFTSEFPDRVQERRSFSAERHPDSFVRWKSPSTHNRSRKSPSIHNRSRKSPSIHNRSPHRSMSPERKKRKSLSRNEETRSQIRSEGEIRVHNLPTNISWRDIDSLFSRHIGDVTYSEIVDNGKTAIVRFRTAKHSRKAVQILQNYKWHESKLYLVETTEKLGQNLYSSHVKYDVGVKTGKHSSDSKIKWKNTYGLSHTFLESLDIRPPLVPKVRFENLDPSITPFKVAEIFNVAGNVLHVNLKYDLKCISKGFGSVEYSHPVEAVQAISMLHNQLVFNRRLKVFMEKDKLDKLKLPDGVQNVGMGLGLNGAPLKNIARVMKSLEDRDEDKDSETMSVICLADLEKQNDSNRAREQRSHHSQQLERPRSTLPNKALKELEDNVLPFACSRDGVNILEKKLTEGTEEEAKVIFSTVTRNLISVITDLHGVLVGIKMLEIGTTAQKKNMLDIVKTQGPGFKVLAQHKYGYKFICKAIEYCPLPLQLEILENFYGYIISLAKHIHGRHVIEACLEIMGPNYVQFVVDEIKGRVLELLQDMDGFLVIKKILIHLPSHMSSVVFEEIIHCSLNIITLSFGVRIIDVVVENGSPTQIYRLIDAIKGVFIFLSQNKTTANILSKCLSLAHETQIDWILNEICGKDHAGLVVMMKDPKCSFDFNGFNKSLSTTTEKVFVESSLSISSQYEDVATWSKIQ